MDTNSDSSTTVTPGTVRGSAISGGFTPTAWSPLNVTSQRVTLPSPLSATERGFPEPMPAPSPNRLSVASNAESTTSSAGRSSVAHYDVTDEEEGSSGSSVDDSDSYWSSDSEYAASPVVEMRKQTETEEEKRRNDEELKARAEMRMKRQTAKQQVLQEAGLHIRQEDAALILDPRRAEVRRRRPPRRPAPAVPPGGRRSQPNSPAVGDVTTPDGPAPPPKDGVLVPALSPVSPDDVQDAYARYEQYRSESQARPPSLPGAPATPQVHSTIELARHTSPPSQLGVPHSVRDATTAMRDAAAGRFTGLLSRMGVTAAEKQPTSKISISGPMDRPSSTASDGRPSSTASEFGSTWSSLVDPSVLNTMEKTDRKRQEAIFEFIATEAGYVRDLQLVVGVFYGRLMTILEERALTVIFANVEDIMMFSTFFYSALEERQKECRLYIDRIGDILKDHCQNLDVYRPYCVNQDSAAKLLVKLRQSDPQLEAALQDIKLNNPDVRGLDLSSFLLEPSGCEMNQLTAVQRITRYPLLLRQIVQYTTQEQDLADVQRALQWAETTVSGINEVVRENETKQRLKDLSDDAWIGPNQWVAL